MAGGEALDGERDDADLLLIRVLAVDRDGLHRLAARLGHEGEDRRSVEPGLEEGAERGAGGHVRPHGLTHMTDQIMCELF